jgi:hypothetical protein
MRISSMSVVLGLAVVAVVVVAVLFLRRSETQAQTMMPVADLQVGPIRHATLPAELEERIRRFEAVFSEVHPRSHEEWLDGFRRDLKPESEVVIWEAIASAYSNFVSENTLGSDARDEAFGLLLMRSMQTEEATISGMTLRHLSQDQAVKLIRSYSKTAKPIQVSK